MALKKLLLHVCCAPCGGFLARELSRDFSVAAYFDNSNIYPKEEFDLRRQEAEKFFTAQGLEFISAPPDHQAWLGQIAGLEREPEKGRRCVLCYYQRLRQTALLARRHGFDCFASTLAISPHKKALIINNLGRAVAKELGLDFLAGDWKKQDGFKKAMAFSRQCGFYHQDYCGCEFSLLARSR